MLLPWLCFPTSDVIYYMYRVKSTGVVNGELAEMNELKRKIKEINKWYSNFKIKLYA